MHFNDIDNQINSFTTMLEPPFNEAVIKVFSKSSE